MISMNTRALLYLFIAMLAMLFTTEKQSFSDDLLSETEILRLANGTKSKYESYVYTVNAYSSISRHKSKREKKEKFLSAKKKSVLHFLWMIRGILLLSTALLSRPGMYGLFHVPVKKYLRIS